MTTARKIDLTRCWEASDRQRALSRRAQALLAAAGMDRPARKWIVITVKPGRDGDVFTALSAARIEAWKPAVMKLPPRRGGMPKTPRVPVEHLVTRGLLFVRVAPTWEAWSGLKAIGGVAGYLGGRDGWPLTLRDEAVDLFRRYLDDDPEAVSIVTNALNPGDRVEIRTGPFAAFPADVVALDDERGRAIVEVMIFGHVNPLHVDIAQLAKL